MHLRKVSLVVAVAALVAVTGCDRSSSNASGSWATRMEKRGLRESEFTELYAEGIRQRLPGSAVKIKGERELGVTLAGGKSLTCYLDNAWNECANQPGQRAVICERYLNGLADSAREIESGGRRIETNAIVPVIKDSKFIVDMNQRYGATNGLAAERLVADIWIAYAADDERRIQYLTEKDRKELGLDYHAMRALATKNLKRIIKKVEQHGSGPIYMFVAGGTYEASLLLSDRLWKNAAANVAGEVVVAVPTRDVLLFTGSESKESVKSLREKAAQLYDKGSYVVSRDLLVRRTNGWVKFQE